VTPLKSDKPHSPQILLVDDNPTNLQVLYQTLEGKGYRLLAARSGRDAIAIAQRVKPDLILLDVMMPQMDGFATCARLKADAATQESPVIFLSALTNAADKVRGLELGAVDFVNKPFQAEEILARVKTHLTIRDLQTRLRKQNEELQHELTVAQELLREARDRTDGVLLGESAAVVRLRRDIDTAAAADDAVLISGPPGSDHESVARAVHHQSARAARAMIFVNCLALADAAPAVGDGVSGDLWTKWWLAQGGTLYLEGVQHLPRDLQRALAERLRTRSDDVRVIVSTTREVDDELAAGRLLLELRQAVTMIVDVPPLRARVDDLDAIARHILRRHADQAGRTVPAIADQSLQRLKRHRWPGNLREFRHVLGLALAATRGDVLDVADDLLETGVRVGSYRLIEQLGSGGMGEVWLARHQLLARPAAIKIVRDTGAIGTEDVQTLRQRFAREAQATAELQSPHTVQLYDFGVTDNGSFYYVMEHLHGMDLQRLVESHGSLQPERVVYLLKQALRSLAEAHAKGLVHRDIKPANLFVCQLGSEFDFLKVVDFGVVSRQSAPSKAPITVTGMVIGTPAYLAPEVLSGHGAFDGRADIYALGCVAVWLLTGRPLFDGTDAMTLLMHHSDRVPAVPSMIPAEVPAELDALIVACLAKDPAQRPTAASLWERLDALRLPHAWNQHRAREWWEQHAPPLTQPD
jgi:DNA-binding NtrC family response regulator